MKYLKFLTEKDWINCITKKILKIADNSINTNGIFNIVLTGGDTPRLIYNELSIINKTWENWHFWLSDERYDPFIEDNLNIEMIKRELFSKINISINQIHFIDVNINFTDSIKNYTDELKSVKIFDLVILGIGEDGHTAGLFPGNYIGDEKDSDDVLGIKNSPKPPKIRITMSANRLSSTERLFYIIKGISKKKALSKLLNKKNLPFFRVKCKYPAIIFYSE